jgi:hypothetical protein
MVTLEARSCEKSGSGLDEDGESEPGVEFREWKDTVLLSEGAKGLAALGACAWTWAWAWGTEGGGARPLPLPRILPPPSFRPDMVAVGIIGGAVVPAKLHLFRGKRCFWDRHDRVFVQFKVRAGKMDG